MLSADETKDKLNSVLANRQSLFVLSYKCTSSSADIFLDSYREAILRLKNSVLSASRQTLSFHQITGLISSCSLFGIKSLLV